MPDTGWGATMPLEHRVQLAWRVRALLGTDVVIPVYADFKPVISGMTSPAECNNLTVNAGSYSDN